MNNELKNAIISKEIVITELTYEQLESIGFQPFYDDSAVLLIPSWAYNFIPDGTNLISIFEKVKIKGIDYIDLDVRGGLLAYGLKVS